jgi:hypothetical protein
MKLRNISSLLMIALVASFPAAALLSSVSGQESPATKIFTDPLTIQTTDVGQTFTVNINVSNVIDLYAWQTGITFSPAVLECTGFYEGEFLKSSGDETLWLQHYLDINNTLGIVYMRGDVILGPKPGIDGSGRLVYATFTSVGIGVSDFHLTDLILLNSKQENIGFEVRESLTVSLEGVNYGVDIANNLTGEYGSSLSPLSGVFDTAFNTSDKTISFDANGLENWYCEVSVPKTLLKCNNLTEWTVRVDDNPILYTATENDTHTLLLFEHDKGNHRVEIAGTESAPIDELALPIFFIVFAATLGLLALSGALLDFRNTRSILRHR